MKNKNSNVLPFKKTTGRVKFTPQEEINRRRREERERRIKKINDKYSK